MNAELLIMFMLGCDRAYLYAHPERELSLDEIRRYDEAIARRSTGVPAQYITGHQEFWGLDLIVSPDVLIPRPETEHIVETVLELVKNNGRSPSAPLRAGSAPSPHKLRIVDLGTGSGAIALALAKELPSAEIHASDISAKALEVARANAARHELTSRIEFHQADLLDGFSLAAFDIVPRNAVFAGPTGLEVIERLIPQAREALPPGGWLVFEISGTIADRVRPLLSDWNQVEFRNDLQGIARVAVARRNP